MPARVTSSGPSMPNARPCAPLLVAAAISHHAPRRDQLPTLLRASSVRRRLRARYEAASEPLPRNFRPARAELSRPARTTGPVERNHREGQTVDVRLAGPQGGPAMTTWFGRRAHNRLLGAVLLVLLSEAVISAPASAVPTPTVHLVWHVRTPMPTGRGAAASATLDGNVYVLGGYTSGQETALQAAEVYNPKTQDWHKIKPMPTGSAMLGGRHRRPADLRGRRLRRSRKFGSRPCRPTTRARGHGVSRHRCRSRPA